MDIRNILGKLDRLTEGTMASAKKKDTGPKFTGKMKGTDPASAAKDKYVGGSMEESIFKELEATLKKNPEERNLFKEFKEFKERGVAETALQGKDDLDAKRKALQDLERESGVDQAAIRQRKLDLDKEAQAKGFSDLDRAVMEGGHELISENPVPPAGAAPAPAPAQPGKPTLGADLTKPQGQENPQQQQQDLKAQQQAAQQEKQEQATLTKGVNALKSAGAAVSNPNQVVKAFGKADDNQGLTPADKNSIASAGTVLAPIMASPQLQGKFKDLVTQASAEQKKQQQQQQNTGTQPQAQVGVQK